MDRLISGSFNAVATKEGHLVGRDHSTLVVRDLSDVVLFRSRNLLPTDVLLRALLKLLHFGEVDAPQRAEGTLLQVTTTVDVHAAPV